MVRVVSCPRVYLFLVKNVLQHKVNFSVKPISLGQKNRVSQQLVLWKIHDLSQIWCISQR